MSSPEMEGMTASRMTSPAQPTRTTGTIGLPQAVALYVCAILGAGVLVFPGQAASLAGPASLLAWGFSALMGVPLAFTFAALATRFPDAGGVATFASNAFGPSAGGVAGWWYFIAGSVGQTIVPLTAGYYVAAALGIGQKWAPMIAVGVLAVAIAANLAGLRTGARLQVVLALGVAAILLAVIVVAIPQIEFDAFSPFAPHGVAGNGQAIVVLFFAFAGWEAVAHLAADFRDVQRTLPRATAVTILAVTVLYLGVAFAVVGTGSYGGRELDRISLGVIIQTGLGMSAISVVAVAAVVICLGTTNAFVAAVSRLGYALGRDDWAPVILSRQNRSGTPVASVLTVGAIGSTGLAGAAVFGWGTNNIVMVPSVLVLATYLLGMASAAQVFTGRRRAMALVAIALLLVTVPFAGWYALLPPAIAIAVVGLRRIRDRQRPPASAGANP